MVLETDFVIRAPTWDDLDAVLALIWACEAHDEGDAELMVDDLRGHWSRARFDLERDAWVVAAGDGRLAGYADVWDRAAGERFLAGGYVRPDCRGHGVGTFLVRAAEERANAKATPGARATISHTIFRDNEAAVRLLVAEGYTPAQHYWRMVMDLASTLPEPVQPGGISIRSYVAGQDDQAVWALVQEAFADNQDYLALPFEEWALFMLDRETFDPSLYFIADAGEEIAGVALCPKYEGWAWVRQLAIRRKWRRRGVGRALMQVAFAEFRRRGYGKVGLSTDSYNRTGARRFYESLGMAVERQHDGYEKKLGARS